MDLPLFPPPREMITMMAFGRFLAVASLSFLHLCTQKKIATLFGRCGPTVVITPKKQCIRSLGPQHRSHPPLPGAIHFSRNYPGRRAEEKKSRAPNKRIDSSKKRPHVISTVHERFSSSSPQLEMGSRNIFWKQPPHRCRAPTSSTSKTFPLPGGGCQQLQFNVPEE